MGRIGKAALEEEMMKYFSQIEDRPILLVDVYEVNESNVITTVDSMIVLYVLESFDIGDLFDVRFVKRLFDKKVLIDMNCVSYDLVTLNGTISTFEKSEKYGCSNPSLHLLTKKMHVAGLSAVVRFAFKFAIRRKKDEKLSNGSKTSEMLSKLLGYQFGCLQACAESSVWTKFCEIEAISMVKDLKQELLKVENLQQSCVSGCTESPKNDLQYKVFSVPKDLIRFENHLNAPVRIHNFRKKLQDLKISTSENKRSGGLVSKQCGKTDLATESGLAPEGVVPHTYAEGPDLTIADLLLFPCIHVAKSVLGLEFFNRYLPTIGAWYERLCAEMPIVPRVCYVSNERLTEASSRINHLEIIVPNVPQESLYKSDPSRYKPKLRLFTKQEDIASALSFLSTEEISALEFDTQEMPFFQWDHLPTLVHPEGGQLPANRIERKAFQLSNLAQVVQNIYGENYAHRDHNSQEAEEEKIKIVDFCSGGGHLGILLAYLLPNCELILVENKEESLRRAESRIRMLGLKNITLYQCNLDYYTGQFDIGVALHACGTATDLVLSKCILQNASFVCCPCCYGAIQPNHMLHYPRSSLFRETFQQSGGQFTLKHYFVLGHAADQTHDEANEKTEQGKFCMRIIDTDRCIQAKEKGYQISIRLMRPASCSPKNHILVGVAQLL